MLLLFILFHHLKFKVRTRTNKLGTDFSDDEPTLGQVLQWFAVGGGGGMINLMLWQMNHHIQLHIVIIILLLAACVMHFFISLRIGYWLILLRDGRKVIRHLSALIALRARRPLARRTVFPKAPMVTFVNPYYSIIISTLSIIISCIATLSIQYYRLLLCNIFFGQMIESKFDETTCSLRALRFPDLWGP